MPPRNRPTSDLDPIDIFRSAGIISSDEMPSPSQIAWVQEKIDQARHDPASLFVDLLQAKRRADSAQRDCAKANNASAELNQLFKNLVEGNADLWHVHRVRQTPTGQRAVCHVHGRLQEFGVHPDVPLEELEELAPWEYVRVHENVVVATWRDDPSLFAAAHGQVVTFKSYIDRVAHLVEVSRNGQEDTVISLPESLWNEELTPASRIVLQRDNPYQAIAIAKEEQQRSKFEKPIENIAITLNDLAGVEEIAEKLINDIQLRVLRTETRDRFDIEAMRGILLYSYKPGMGKSKFVAALSRTLFDYREQIGCDIVLYEIKPNETKNMYHGEDSRIMRDDVWGKVRSRQAQPRTRPLIQIVVFDEVDSFGKRGGGNDPVFSSAQNDALEAMLVEMDGLGTSAPIDGPPVHVLCIGMTNRPDRVDDAAKRPGRFGDLVLAMPEVTIEGALNVMAIYCRHDALPWHLDGEVQTRIGEERVRAHFLRPALSSLFGAVVAHYKTDTQRSVDVTAGQIMANVHFMDAVNSAKKRAAIRSMHNAGVPAVSYDDIVDCLLDSALGVARQMEADPQMLVRHLQVNVPVTHVDVVPKHELAEHRYLRVHSA